MSKDDYLLALGREKVIDAGFKKDILQVPSKALEMLGVVLELDFHGFGGELADRLQDFEDENMFFDFRFYEYVNGELHECSLEKAVNTNEFKNHGILLFSQIEDEERMFYLEIVYTD